jgi:hypothetical protein
MNLKGMSTMETPLQVAFNLRWCSKGWKVMDCSNSLAKRANAFYDVRSNVPMRLSSHIYSRC